MASLGDLIVKVGANFDAFDAAMGDMSSKLRAAVRDADREFSGFDAIGSRLQGLGLTLTAALTAPIAAAGGAAIKMASDFDLAMREVNSLLGQGATDASFKRLSEGVLDLSKRLGIDAVGATHALYEAISANIPEANAISFVEVAAKAAIAGLTDTKVAVDGLTTVINAYHLDVSKAQEITDAMFKGVVIGKYHFEELSSSIGLAASSASVMGVSYQELIAAGTTITRQGVTISEAFTQISMAMKSLIAPNKEMNALIKETGFSSGQALVDAKGFEGALLAIQQAAHGNNAALEKATGRIEGFRAILELTGQNAKTAKEDLDAINNSAGATALAFGQIDQSTSRQFQRLMTEVKDTAIALGTALLPTVNAVLGAMKPFAESLGEAAKWFAELPPSVQTGALAFAAVVAAIGPLVLGLGAMISAFATIGTAVTAVLGPFGGLSGVFVAAATGLAGFVAAIPGAIASVLALADAMVTQAVASLTLFARQALPVAALIISEFAVTTIPAAIAALQSFSLSAIPGAIAGLSSLATTGFSAVIAAVTNLSVTALPILVGALSAVAIAAGLAGAAFAGWKLGEWLYNNSSLMRSFGDTVGGVITKITMLDSVIASWSGANAKAKEAQESLAQAVEGLRKKLADKGIVIDKGNQSLEEYAKKLRAAASEVSAHGTATVAAADSVKRLKDEQTKANQVLDVAQKAYAEMVKQFKSGQATQDDVNRAFQSLQQAANKAGVEINSAGQIVGKAGAAHKAAAVDVRDHGGAMEESTTKAKSFKEEISAASIQTDIWRETIRQNEEQHKALIKQIVAAQIALKDWPATMAELQVANENLAKAMEHYGEAQEDVSKIKIPAGIKAIDESKASIYGLNQALKDLGVQSTTSYDQVAADAKKAYDAVMTSGVATNWEKDNAMLKMLKAQAEAMKANGKQIPEDMGQMMDDLQKKVSGKVPEVVKPFQDLADKIHDSVSHAFDQIIDKLVTGNGSFKDILTGMWQDIGSAVLHKFLDPARDAIADFISNTITSLLSGQGFGGIMDSLTKIGEKIAEIFTGTASSVAGGAANAGGAAAGAGGAASGAAASGIAGMVTAIASVVTAVTGVISIFQNMHQETSLNAIEHNTRYSMEYLGERSDGGILGQLFYMGHEIAFGTTVKKVEELANIWMPRLSIQFEQATSTLGAILGQIGDISSNTFWSLSQLQQSQITLNSMLTAMNTKGGGSTFTVNVSVTTSGSATQMARDIGNALVSDLQLRGAFQ